MALSGRYFKSSIGAGLLRSGQPQPPHHASDLFPRAQQVSLEQYRQPLTRVAVLRTLRELSHVYMDLGLDRVAELLPIMTIHDILVLVADSRKAGFIKVR